MRNTKIKISSQEFILNNYNEVDNKGDIRPYVSFDIESHRDNVEPLAQIPNQTFFIIFENGEIKNLSSKCVLFGTCTNDHNTKCQLVMENYSDMELMQQAYNDLLEV